MSAPIEIRRYLTRCRRRQYWLAHEELEPLWIRQPCDFYRGLIHLVAGLLHAERGNRRGARTKIGSAAALLSSPPGGATGVRADALVEAVRALLPALEAGETLDLDVSAYFPASMRADAVDDIELPYRVRRYDRGYRPWRTASSDVSDSAADDEERRGRSD